MAILGRPLQDGLHGDGDDFYVLVPDLWEPGVYTAVFSDGSSARYVPIEPTPESPEGVSLATRGLTLAGALLLAGVSVVGYLDTLAPLALSVA